MSIIEIYNTHCCGEIGDVIVAGDIQLEGETIFEQSKSETYRPRYYSEICPLRVKLQVYRHMIVILVSQ